MNIYLTFFKFPHLLSGRNYFVLSRIFLKSRIKNPFRTTVRKGAYDFVVPLQARAEYNKAMYKNKTEIHFCFSYGAQVSLFCEHIPLYKKIKDCDSIVTSCPSRLSFLHSIESCMCTVLFSHLNFAFLYF